jgi:hypothetical protein
MLDTDIGLHRRQHLTSPTELMGGESYVGVVDNVISDRQVDPLRLGDHGGTVDRAVLDNFQLVSWANAT